MSHLLGGLAEIGKKEIRVVGSMRRLLLFLSVYVGLPMHKLFSFGHHCFLFDFDEAHQYAVERQDFM